MISNQQGFDRRMSLVEDIMRFFGLEGKSITPVEYIEHCPFPFNNFIYKVALSSPATAESFTRAAHHACTVLPPSEGVSTVVVRLSNPIAMGMNNTNRVENEVAAMAVARDALCEYPGLVPGVYAWKGARVGEGSCAEKGFGWTVMEYMNGEALDGAFKGMEEDEKRRVVDGVAGIFAALQRAKLPSGVKLHGGLTIRGVVVSGQATLQKGEPGEYAAMWKRRVDEVLEEAEESELIDGWRGNLRERIEKFKNEGLERALCDGGVDVSLLGLVHNDFTMNNMLYDAQTKRITALLDFDWASITHPAHEFFMSFHNVHGCMAERSEKLRGAILTGDFGAGPGEGDEEAWELAKMWDEAVKRHGGMRPSDFKGIEVLEDLRNFVDKICPFEIGNEVMLKRRSLEENEAIKASVEKEIEALLDGWGV